MYCANTSIVLPLQKTTHNGPGARGESHRMLLRPRLNCHYCGGRSLSRQKRGGKFTCQHCQAVNFLDENGEIADVPPDEILEAESRAIPPESTPATAAFPGDSYFCSTCVKNQLLYNNALSEYLPEPSDPNYDQYEAHLSTYKKELEDRYPQVCRQCEPRVREKLQQAVYTAKADHVRRLLDRSRARRVSHGWGWRSLVIRFAGAGAILSVVGQLLWHLMGATTDPKLELRHYSPLGCIPYIVMFAAVPTRCGTDYAVLAGYALALGTTCVWWNPKWIHKIEGREGRLIGLGQFYKVQAGLLVLRFLSWLALREMDSARTPSNVQKSIHGVLLVLWTVVTGWSMLAIIQVDNTPLVNWHQDPAQLLSQTQFIPPASQEQSYAKASDFPTSSTTPQRFPVGALSSDGSAEYTPWRPPTPPDDPEAMEWEPVQVKENFSPRPRPLPRKRNEPSPFYGRLPTLGDQKRLQYPDVPAPAEGVGIPPGFFERPQTTWTGPTRPEMAEARLKVDLRQDPDTGLENIFGKVFSLDDDKSRSVRVPEQESDQPQYGTDSGTKNIDYQELEQPQQWTATATLAAVSTGALMVGIAIWLLSDLLPGASVSIKFWITRSAACIPLLHLMLNFPHFLRSSESFYLFIELCILAILGGWRLWYSFPSGATCDKLALATMSFLLWQEFYMIWTSDNSVAPTAASHMGEAVLQPPSNAFTEDSTSMQAAATHTQPAIIEPDLMDTTAYSSTTPSQSTRYAPTTYSTRARSPSINSTTSSLSTNTTSTTSAWGHTPKTSSTRSSGFGMAGLSMTDTYSSGTTVAGPRRRMNDLGRDGGGSTSGRYR